MLDAPIDRTRVTTAALPRSVQLGVEADHERRSAAELLPLWWNASSAINVSSDINVLPLKTQINQRVPASPSRHYLFKLEITFCVRGVVSPVLSNLYLHFVLDLWFEKKIKPQCRGEAYLLRFADDFVVSFQFRKEVDDFQQKVRKRFAEFGLELAEEKTRRILFGRFAGMTCLRHGLGRPETFEFLGFKHVCGVDRA